MMYFSFTVLTSTGFGEITPVSKMARSLIIIEQVLGVMYVAFLIARLANLYRQAAAATGPGDPGSVELEGLLLRSRRQCGAGAASRSRCRP